MTKEERKRLQQEALLEEKASKKENESDKKTARLYELQKEELHTLAKVAAASSRALNTSKKMHRHNIAKTEASALGRQLGSIRSEKLLLEHEYQKINAKILEIRSIL